MKKLKVEDLEKELIKEITINGEKYFSIKDIKMKFPNVKFNIDNILDLPDIGRCIKVIDIQPMTEFDLSIRRFKNK